MSGDECTPFSNGSLYTADVCEYVKHVDACEGGGYLAWTQIVVCQESESSRGLLIAVSVLYMLYLFVALGTAADEFFSTTIASIAEQLGISENVAGVSFMAFGNGAPDIFSSVVAVLGVGTPKVSLVMGQLLGAAIFVTTCVVATIVFVKPFRVSRRPFVRDILFFLVALGVLLSVVLTRRLTVWQPVAFLVLYLLYAATVIYGKLYTDGRFGCKVGIAGLPDVGRRRSTVVSHGKFFVPETREELEEYAAAVEGMSGTDENGERYGSFNSRISARDDAQKEATLDQPHEAKARKPTKSRWLQHIVHALTGSTAAEFRELSWASKVITILQSPCRLLLRLTVPCPDNAWSKILASMHIILSPTFIVIAFHSFPSTPVPGGPGLWAYTLATSAVLQLGIIMLTGRSEPRFYKPIAAFCGFVVSTAWIFLVAAEVVSIVTMLGAVSKIPSAIVGLTVLAWSNSIGDLVADVSVARQGLSRMAVSAAFGGQLFNTLIGFGMPFLIATLQRGTIEVECNLVVVVMLSFLALSLVLSLTILALRRFFASRWYAAVLLVVYLAFIAVVILCVTTFGALQ